MQKIIEGKKLDPNVRLTWENDDAEYVCKIWEWRRWSRDNFTSCALELRLVVLSQISIYSVEQVFLRLKLVEDDVGENMKNDMLGLRMFLQCNGDLSELLEGITMVIII